MPSAMNERRRRVRAERSIPRFDPCLPRSADRPPAGLGLILVAMICTINVAAVIRLRAK